MFYRILSLYDLYYCTDNWNFWQWLCISVPRISSCHVVRYTLQLHSKKYWPAIKQKPLLLFSCVARAQQVITLTGAGVSTMCVTVRALCLSTQTDRHPRLLAGIQPYCVFVGGGGGSWVMPPVHPHTADPPRPPHPHPHTHPSTHPPLYVLNPRPSPYNFLIPICDRAQL